MLKYCVLEKRAFFASLIWGMSGTYVSAEGESSLIEKASSVTLDSIINKSDGKKEAYPWNESTYPDITYGDTLFVYLSWAFEDSTIISPNEVFTYKLPDQITFNDVAQSPVFHGNTRVGYYTITDNVISIWYDDKNFCKRDNRKGALTFSGIILKDENGGQATEDVIITFPDQIQVKFHMLTPTITSEMKINKLIWRVNPPDGLT
ncbi:MAG: hypothetical protein K6E10_05365 [Eubacterium sp.]|nr:hypothetical protein [Eubacterium sp.]